MTNAVGFEVVTGNADLFYGALNADYRAAVLLIMGRLRAERCPAPHGHITHVANQNCRACFGEAVGVVVFDLWNGGKANGGSNG